LAKVYLIIFSIIFSQGILFSQNLNLSTPIKQDFVYLPGSTKEQVLTGGRTEQGIKFEHITNLDGLSHNNVTSIYQDSDGFMWFGTHDGLNKYDGYNFVIYYHDPKDSSSLSDSYISAIREDIYGNIWVGTTNGLNKLNPVTGQIKNFHNEPDNPNSISSNYITALYIDSNNSIWIGNI